MATQYTGVAQVDDSIILLMDAAFLTQAFDRIVMDNFADIERDINAKSIDITKYNKLAKITAALTETTDPDGVQLVDAKATLTPAEYGNVITRTNLARLQTGGKVDLAAAKLVGGNMAESMNGLACVALDASSNELVANSAANEAALVAGDTVQSSDIEYCVNRLRRTSIPPYADGYYRAVCHPDVLDDIAKLADWKDYEKYFGPGSPDYVRNWLPRVYKQCVWVSTAGATVNADAGVGAVDSYHTHIFGQNALGKAISQDPVMIISGPFDKLGRFVHVGWYGVFHYAIVDQASLWMLTSSSSFGANT